MHVYTKIRSFGWSPDNRTNRILVSYQSKYSACGFWPVQIQQIEKHHMDHIYTNTIWFMDKSFIMLAKNPPKKNTYIYINDISSHIFFVSFLFLSLFVAVYSTDIARNLSTPPGSIYYCIKILCCTRTKAFNNDLKNIT